MDENKIEETVETTEPKANKFAQHLGTIFGGILFGCGVSIVIAVTIRIVQWILGF